MKIFPTASLAASLLMVFTPSLSYAKDQTERATMRFERLDTNKDGKVTLEETLARANARFDKADTNGDGEISVEEMVVRIERRRLERRAKRMLSRMDYDGDGKVTKDELQNRAKKRFSMMDRNDDGQIEKAEMHHNKRGMHRGKHHRSRHHRGNSSDL